MAEKNFKIKHGLDIGDHELITASGNIILPAGGTIQDSDGNPVTAQTSATRTSFTATASQSSFTVDYTAGQVDVFLNGIKLTRITDFTDSSETAIVLTDPANEGDIVDVIAYNAFEVANTYTVSAADYQLSLKADLSDLLLKADKSNVLELDNTTAYSPTAQYHPATKAYVDALASSGGGNVSITQGFTFTGDGSTTTFDCGSADSYILGAIDIYHNGLQLDGSDYTAADGQTFTLSSLTPASGDIIKLVAYGGADVYNKTQTDTLLAGKADLSSPVFGGVPTMGGGLLLGDSSSNEHYLYNSGIDTVTIRLNNGTTSSGYLNFQVIDSWVGLNAQGGGLSLATAGTNRVYLDSNGNVGIGTSSPATNLTLGTGTTGVSFQSGNTSFHSGKIAVIKPIEVGSGNGHLVFETYEGGSGGAERMRIDNAGRVTTPYQPAFNVTSTASFSVHDWAPYTDTYVNIGNHMNASTGVFTVPVSGTYVFFFGTIGTTDHADVDVYLKVNGVTTRGAVARPDDTGAWSSMAAGTGILTLSANDTVNVWSSATNVYSDVNQWAHFRGYLLG